LLVVEKFPGTNTLDVTHGVESALAELQPGLSGLTVDSTIYRPATFIETALGNLSWVLLGGAALMVLVFGLWFRNWRIALISAIVIPVSVTIATLVLYLRNASMNVIVFAGLLIAVASLVNDAIIDVDNIVRLLRRHRQEGSTKSTTSIVVEGSLEVRRGIIFATLISALMVLPIFFIEGVTGAFFQPLVLSYGLAVLASMAVATTLTTALSLILLTNVSVDRREFSLVEKIRRGYEAALTSTIYRPRLVLLAIAGSLVIGLAMLPLLGLSLLPDFKERDLLVRLDGAPGTSQTAMTRIAGLVSRELRSTPGIRNVGAHVGRAVLGDQVVSVNSTEFWVSIDPSANYDKTVAAIRKVVGSYPGLNDQVLTYLHDASGDVAEKPSNSIVVRVYGDTDAVLQATATDIQKAITGINGIVDAHIDLPIQQLTLETEVSIDKAQRYGLKPGDVRRAAATMLSGTQVGNLFEEQKIFDVVVWSTPDTRHSLSSIRDLLIDTPAGEQVHLGDVAEVRIVSSPSVIRHEGAKRYFDVVANVRGRDLGAVAADIKTRLRQVQYPLEYHAEVLGDYVTRQASQTRLVELAIAAAIGILFLLQAACGSWRLATLVILSLATALVGGVLAVFVTDGSLSLGSIAGLIAVCGIATRDTVMLINQCQILQRIRGIPFGPKLVVSGTIGRLSPILVSALAIGVAFAPALLLGDVPGLEILRPMAVVVLGGLVTSTLVTLFLVPTLYARFGILETQNLELPPLTVATRGGVLGDLADVPEMSAGS
jgi:Cu/Ag efflux pump CusA